MSGFGASRGGAAFPACRLFGTATLPRQRRIRHGGAGTQYFWRVRWLPLKMQIGAQPIGEAAAAQQTQRARAPSPHPRLSGTALETAEETGRGLSSYPPIAVASDQEAPPAGKVDE